MTTDTWLLYVGTVLIFMSTPGPSHLLMLSVSMSNGFHRSLATAAGDLSANAIQILLAGCTFHFTSKIMDPWLRDICCKPEGGGVFRCTVSPVSGPTAFTRPANCNFGRNLHRN